MSIILQFTNAETGKLQVFPAWANNLEKEPVKPTEIKKVIAGGWKPAPYGAFLGIAQGGGDIACCGAAVPKDKATAIMAERDAIMKGKHVYAGPMSDREGKERIAAGAMLGDADLWKMDWYVKGVVTQK